MANNTNDAAAAQSSFDDPVYYRDLKEWIQQQELTGKPLSPLQRRTITELTRSTEPEIGDRDWVSLMNRNQTTLASSPSQPPSLTPTRLPPSSRRQRRIHRQAHGGREMVQPVQRQDRRWRRRPHLSQPRIRLRHGRRPRLPPQEGRQAVRGQVLRRVAREGWPHPHGRGEYRVS